MRSRHVWKVGKVIPTGNVFYPESGKKQVQNMHDSDLFAPNSSHNLVQFTNNTVKYRHYKGKSNIPLNAAWDNIPGEIPDTVLNPAYPWASDSLNYFWDFGDKYAVNCTSTVANTNVHCQFSIEKLPKHLYKQKGVYEARLFATDTVYHTTSLDSITIYMLKPNAKPDSIYLGLNHKEQVALDSVKRKGRRGLILRGENCVNAYQYPDLDEVYPKTLGAKYWIAFDVAADCDTVHYSLWQKGKRIDTFYLDCEWVASQTIEGDSFAYQYKTGGLKTVGLVVGVGNEYDTFFYRAYKPIYDPRPDLEVTYNDSDLFEPYPEVKVQVKSTDYQDSLYFYIIEEIRFDNIFKIETSISKAGFDSIITFKRTQGQPFGISAIGVHNQSGCKVGRYEHIWPKVQSCLRFNRELCSGDTITFGHETFYLEQNEDRTPVIEPYTQNQINPFGHLSKGVIRKHQDFFIKDHYNTARGKWLNKPYYQLPTFPEVLAWDFDNDSVFDAYGSNPKWVFNKPGFYRPSLFIRDSLGQWRRVYSISDDGYPNEIRVSGIEHFASPRNMLDTQLFCGNRTIEMDHILREPFVAGERVITNKWKVVETGDEFDTDLVFLRGKGTYHLTYEIETNLGCKSRKLMKWPIQVIGPKLNIEYLGLTQACLPASLQYHLNGKVDSSHWYVNRNLLAKYQSQDSISLALMASGKHELEAQIWSPLFDKRLNKIISCPVLYRQNGKDQIQLSKPIKAWLAGVELNDEDLYYFEAKPAFAEQYDWWLNGMHKTSTSQHKWSTYFNWYQKDSQQVCVKIRNGQCSDSTCISFNESSQNHVSFVSNYLIYPSLVTDLIRVEGSEEKLEYMILNSLGELVITGNLEDQILNTQMLCAGMYFLVLKDRNAPVLFKFFKE